MLAYYLIIKKKSFIINNVHGFIDLESILQDFYLIKKVNY